MKAALGQVVPRVFSDAGETVGFAETGETFEAARLALAAAIEKRAREGAEVRTAGRRAAAPGVGRGRVGRRRVRPASPRPRLFVAERDPFAGLPALKARWAAGERPCRGPAGPRAVLAPLAATSPSRGARSTSCGPTSPTGWKGSSRYVRYLNRAMAFDWLYGYAGFDAALKDAGGGGPRGRGRADARAAVAAGTRPRPRTTTTPRASWPSPSSRSPRSKATRRWKSGRRRCAPTPGAPSTTSWSRPSS